jgi:phage terminase large subunit
LGAAGNSRRQTLAGLGVMNIKDGAPQDPEERINASRQLIPITWFDEEKCALGLNRLRAYRKRWNRTTSSYTGPLHDNASHGSDAFGEFAANRREAKAAAAKGKPPITARVAPSSTSWLQ